MLVSKYPDELNADKLIYNEVVKKNMICPFCGEDREYSFIEDLKANFKNSDSITDKQIEEAIDRVILEGKSLTMENVIQTLSSMKPKTNEMSMM